MFTCMFVCITPLFPSHFPIQENIVGSSVSANVSLLAQAFTTLTIISKAVGKNSPEVFIVCDLFKNLFHRPPRETEEWSHKLVQSRRDKKMRDPKRQELQHEIATNAASHIL